MQKSHTCWDCSKRLCRVCQDVERLGILSGAQLSLWIKIIWRPCVETRDLASTARSPSRNHKLEVSDTTHRTALGTTELFSSVLFSRSLHQKSRGDTELQEILNKQQEKISSSP